MVWRYRLRDEFLTAGALLVFAFVINRTVQIKGLFMDDLYMWTCFAEGSFLDFVFPAGSSRFRFIYNMVMYLQFLLVGSHVEWFVPLNIAVNALIAYSLYRIARELANSGVIGFSCGILYLLSRMSYYQIGQVYGMMESLALWAAVAILYGLYRFLNGRDERGRRYFAACGLYFTVCFIHERYMVLFPLFLIVLFMKKEKRPLYWAVPSVLFVLVQVIRLLAIGSVMPAGTGGTFVADTFQIRQVLGFIAQQILYLFGINTGPEHLSACPWDQTARWVKLTVAAECVLILLAAGLFLARIIGDRKNRRKYIHNSLLFLFFIGACVTASSVTIRVEVRWVYVSMTAAWLFLAYMCGVISGYDREEGPKPKQKEKEKPKQKAFRYYRNVLLCDGLVLAYTALSLLSENYYRGYYPNIYFWHSQEEYNSLAEETWETYGEEIFGKKIYILKNNYGVSQFYADNFFKVYDKQRKAEGTEVRFVDSIHDFGLVTDNMLVLREEPRFYAYQDVTGMVRDLKCESVYGYYRDGWMDESARIRVMAGSTGEINLQLLYPGTAEGGEVMTIRMNGQPARTVRVDRNILSVTLETDPFRTVELDFENNFYLKDAQEQRGEKRLSLIVNITAD